MKNSKRYVIINIHLRFLIAEYRVTVYSANAQDIFERKTVKTMMTKFFKTLCLALALSTLMLAFTGCEKKPGLYAWYGGRMNVDTVMTIHVDGGEGEKTYEVPFDTYRAVFLYLKKNVSDIIQDSDGNITSLSTDAEKTAAIKEVAEEILTKYYCLVAACEKYGITITEEDRQGYEESYQKKLQTYIESMDGTEEYEGTLEEYVTRLYEKTLALLGTTPEYFEFSYYRSLLEQRLKMALASDLDTYLNQSYYHYKQVVIPYTKGDFASEEQAREKILEAWEKLQNGTDMDSVIREYSPDKEYQDIYFDSNGGIVGSSSGSSVGTFTMEAVCALNFNEYSDIISGDNDDYIGYFAIFQRLDIDEEFVCSSDKIGTLIYQYPYIGASSYSIYYTDYSLILDSYINNTALVPVNEKVYKRISVKTLY